VEADVKEEEVYMTYDIEFTCADRFKEGESIGFFWEGYINISFFRYADGRDLSYA
jgi:hypothetical protein